MSKTLKALFTLSVALNVLLVGAGTGFAIKEWREGERWQIAKNEMSPVSREKMSKRFQKARQDMQPLFTEMRQSREQMKAILAQENFDSQGFDRIVSHLRDLRLQMSEQMSAAAKEMIVAMPSEERRKMADHLIYGFSWKHNDGPGGGQWHCTRESYGPDKVSENK